MIEATDWLLMIAFAVAVLAAIDARIANKRVDILVERMNLKDDK